MAIYLYIYPKFPILHLHLIYIDGDKDFNEYLQYIEVFLKQKCREGDYFGPYDQKNISKFEHIKRVIR